MHPKLTDPHNHAPDVTPDDEWGDAETLSASFPGAATILPPKRAKSDTPRQSAAEGIRIEPGTYERRESVEDSTFEVSEINGSVVRLDPELSSAPRIPRQATGFQERPALTHDRSVDKHWGKSRKQSVRWILGTGAGVAGLVVLAMMLLPLVNKSNAARPSSAVREPEEGSGNPTAEEKLLNDLLQRQPEAEQVFRIFARSSVTSDFLPILRKPKSVEKIVRAQPTRAWVGKDWLPGDNTIWQVFHNQETCFGILEGSLPDYTKFKAFMVLDKQGHLRLDWKATTAYSTASFGELANHTGDPSEIRAEILPSNFYTTVFPESEYQSYQLLSPNREELIWTYARRDSKAFPKIDTLFHSGGIVAAATEPQRVTLRLAQGPDGSQPNQWLIEELLHKDWIIP